MTSTQWCYLHNNIIFLVIILILKHVWVKLMQKYLILVINCLLCCMNWYSWGVIRSSHRILYTFTLYSYSCKILQPYVAATIRTHSDAVLPSTGAPYVGYTGMCHQPGSIFHFQKSRTGPNFEVLLQNMPYLLKFYSRTGCFFDNLVSNAWLKCQNPSCFQLLFPAA